MTAPNAAPSNTAGSDHVTARTVEAVERLRPLLEAQPWQRLDPVPDYFLTVVREHPEVIRPHVHLQADGARAFVGRVEDLRLATTAGYRTIYSPRVRALVLALGGVLGADDADGASAVVEHLREALAEGEADVALLPKLPTGSSLFQAASEVRFPARQPAPAASLHWELQLPATFDEFLRSRSKSTRDAVKRGRNRLQREFGERLRFEVFRDEASAEVLFRDAGAIAAKTYQHGLGVAFADSDLDRALTRLGLARGWFRSYVLYLDDEPAAFWPGAAWAGTFFIGTPGYDPRFAEYSLGKLVLARLIEDLCADEDVRRLDFGSGDALYKRQFGTESWLESDVTLFATRHRAVRINVTRSVLESGVALAKKAASRAGVAEALRRRSRARVSAGG